MKIILCLTCACAFALHTSVYPQGTRISIEAKNKTIRQVIQEIEAKSEYRFFYNDQLANLDDRIDFKVKNMNEFEAIEQLFRGQELTFKLMENNLVLIVPTSLAQQPRTITGTVIGPDGEPLIGATITIKGTTTGTITNAEGKYTLSVPEDAILLFSFVGMESQEIPVAGQNQINVMMREEPFGMDEVVVVGYGTQKRVNITGAVDVIGNDQLENRPSPTVSQLLQGQVPGVEFSIAANGFEPGAELGLQIRGIGSISNSEGGQPYVVIDGFPGDMNRLNPEDIKSISVLKDAAASAIYGARAPYGVILITTKSGRKNTKFTATYSGNVSIAIPQPLPDPLDSYTFARVYNEAGANGGGIRFSDEVIDRIIAYQNGDWDYLKQFMPEGVTHYETVPRYDRNTWAGDNLSHANNNWFDIHFGHAVNQNHNFSIYGGTDKTSYYFSAGVLNQESVLKYAPDSYNRFNLSAKIDVALTDWWDFRYEPRFMKSTRVMPNNQRADDEGRTDRIYTLYFHAIFLNYPTAPLYDGYGNITWDSRIPILRDAGKNTYETTENWHTLATEIRPLKGWKINADVAYQALNRFDNDYTRLIYTVALDGSLRLTGRSPNQITNIHHNDYYYTTNIYTSYDLPLTGGHNLMLMAGTQFEYSKARRMRANKTGLIVEDVPSLETATGEAVVSENLLHWATAGYYGRLTYNYKERYLLQSNVRYDGTSRFREGKRWGFFPSVGVGWVISNENFWEPVASVVNYLKFRGSWGSLGNQNVDAYQDLELIPLSSDFLDWIFGYGSTRPIGYTGTPALISPNLTWETATTKNLGLESTFLNRRLRFNLDIFERLTSNMIGPAEPKPGILGASAPDANNATLRTRGWEAQLMWQQSLGNGISYFVNLNMYDNKSVVTKYNNPNNLISGWYEGKEVGEIWGFTINDLYRTQQELEEYVSSVDLSYISTNWNTGDVKYEDINGDGKIDKGSGTLEDPGDLSIIGNSTPHYQYGISAGVNFRGFDLSMLWKGTGKRELYFGGFNGTLAYGFISSGSSSVYKNHLDYFRDQPGDKYTGLEMGDANINKDAFFPRPYLTSAENRKNNEEPNTYLLQDASYIRLQNVQLGYNLPQKITSRLKLENLRVYFSGDNLLTFSKLPVGIDPVAAIGYVDSALGKNYGADRIFSFGLTVTY